VTVRRARDCARHLGLHTDNMGCFSRCCCCVNLRTGGLMMGLMTAALSIFSIVPTVLSLVDRLNLSRVVVHMLNRYGVQDGSGESTSPDSQQAFEPVDFWGTVTEMFHDKENILPPEDDDKVVRLASAMLVFHIVCIILLVVYLICSLMLMYGSFKGSRWLLLPWLVATLLFILAYLTGMCLSTALFGLSVLSLSFLVIAIIESCIALYLWVCVISLFQHLADRQANQGWELKPRLNTSYKGVPTDER